MSAKKTGTGSGRLDSALRRLGYAYDANQKIFYSTLDAWQRKYGYCRLYDEVAAIFSMIVDCEPIKFVYGGKRWLIQFWKGQYALATGGEIGVFLTDKPDIDIPGVFNGPFYEVVSNEELLHLSFTLHRKGETLFSRQGKHWWLTGFILGDFSEPWDLTMEATVTFKDEMMLQAFMNGLKEAGYGDHETAIDGRQVSLIFGEPRTPQPVTRNPSTDWLIQRKNEMLCKLYQDITGQIETMADKFKEIKQKAPELFDQAMNIGKPAPLFESFDILQHYLT